MIDDTRYTESTKKLMSEALREALSLGHNYIGTEHVLLAMSRQDVGVPSAVFARLKIGPDSIRHEVTRMLSLTARDTVEHLTEPEGNEEQTVVEQRPPAIARAHEVASNLSEAGENRYDDMSETGIEYLKALALLAVAEAMTERTR